MSLDDTFYSAQKRRAFLQRVGVDAFLVRDVINIRWMTGFDAVFDEEQAHALLILPDNLILHTDSRYTGAAAAAARQVFEDWGVTLTLDSTRESHAAFARRCAPEQATLGFEGSVSYAEFTKIAEQFPLLSSGDTAQSVDASGAIPQNIPIVDGASDVATAIAAHAAPSLGNPARVPHTALVSTTDACLLLRAVKTPQERARLKAAQAITDAAFSHMVATVHPGMTERHVQQELDKFMLRHGAEAVAFPSIVATGAHGANPHAQPSDTVLEAGQCVVMDFGAKAQGYCSDMTRMLFLGQPSDRIKHAYEVLREANERVEATIRPGLTGKEAHLLAEKVLEEGGFGGRMGHGLGHGVGLQIHELPTLSPRNDMPLEPGNVVTVEPGIYLPGEFGMRLEDFGVVSDGGFEVFTQSTHEMVVI